MKNFYILTIVSLALFGCDNARFKSGLQARLDERKNSALCYFLPSSVNQFPSDVFSQPIETELLDIFVDLTLLSKRELSLVNIDNSKTQGWRYQLTVEGTDYFQSKMGAFCFGHVVVDEIYDSDNIEFRILGMREGTGKWLYYNYYYDNIPDWAKDKRFVHFYNIIDLNHQKLYKAKSTFSDSSRTYTAGFDMNKTITLKTK